MTSRNATVRGTKSKTKRRSQYFTKEQVRYCSLKRYTATQLFYPLAIKEDD